MNTDEQVETMRQVLGDALAKQMGIGYYYVTAETARAALAVVPMPEWQPIETAPKGEMFQWGYWRRGKFSTGLAYWNVSGGWSDAYGHPAPERATHCRILPAPPERCGPVRCAASSTKP